MKKDKQPTGLTLAAFAKAKSSSVGVLIRELAARQPGVRAVVTTNGGGVSLGNPERSWKRSESLWRASTAGHMIAIIPEIHLLFDGTLDQAQDLTQGIRRLPSPFVAHASSAFIAGKEPARFSLKTCELIYDPDRIPAVVRKTGDWSSFAFRRSVFEEICAAIDQAMPLDQKEWEEKLAQRGKMRSGPFVRRKRK